MSQFEYNDLRKFFVSVGVFLIGLTFLLPWLFFREQFDLLIKDADLKTYTEIAQSIIRKRQYFSSYFSGVILIVSAVSFILGIVLFIKGIQGWIRLDENNKKMESLRLVEQQLKNKKLSQDIERDSPTAKTETQTGPTEEFIPETETATNKSEDVIPLKEEPYLKIPINHNWILNHWGSDVSFIERDKMIFRGIRTRLETDGCHINLKDILTIGKLYKVSCFVKSLANTTGKFQLWCHDNIGIDPHGSEMAIPYATPSIEGERCSLRFDPKFNSNLRIHLQYMPGEGQIEVSDLRIVELQ